MVIMVTLRHRRKPSRGCRKMSESFVKTNMYQRASQVKYYQRNVRYTKEKIKCLQAYSISKNKNDKKIQAHLRLSLTKKHRAHLLLSKNKTHCSLSFSLFYTKQKISLTCPYGSFLCMEFNCLKATEPQDSLPLTTKAPGVCCTLLNEKLN